MLNSTHTPIKDIQRTRRENAEITSFRSEEYGYSLDCLTSIEEIEAIKSEWLALERDSMEPFTYFQCFDWCHQWCLNMFDQDTINREAVLRVYVLRCDGAAVMILPMMTVKTRTSARILTFLTDPMQQYANALVDRQRISEKTGRRHL